MAKPIGQLSPLLVQPIVSTAELFAEGVGIGPLSGVAFVAQIAEPRISPTVSGISAFFILNDDQGGFASYPKTNTKSPDEED